MRVMLAEDPILNLLLFVVLLFGLTIVLDLLFKEVSHRHGKDVLSKEDLGLMVYGVIRMYIPLSAATITILLSSNQLFRVTEFLLKWFRIDLYVILISLMAPLIPFTVTLLYIRVIGLLSLLDTSKYNEILEKFDNRRIVAWLKILAISYIAGITVNAVVAMGEEYGWRAFLFDKLYTYIGLITAIIVSGVIWGLWHIPIVVLLKFKTEFHEPVISSIQYILFCLILAIPESILLMKTNSILPVAVFHGSINAIWRITEPLTKITNGNKTTTILCASMVSLLLWLIVSVFFTIILLQLT